MKTSVSKLYWAGLLVLFLWSCKKDETKAYINTAAPTLTATASTLVLNQTEAAQTAVTFSWNNVDYGFSDALNYVLQISKGGTSFASASTTEVAVSKAVGEKSMTVGDLNKELNKILSPGSASEVEVRLKSDAGNILSNVVQMTVTPYRDLILYSWPQAINVAGNYQGWDPKTAPQLVSLTKTNDKYTKFEGFIEFNDPAPAFKFVKGNDWSAGDFGSAGAGKLGNGGSDLKLTEGAGTYLIQADIDALIWSAYKITGWGLIGDAVPVTGWNSDQDLTYDAATKTWRITLDLVKGSIKFRANDDWAVNLGDKGNDGKPELGGDNIPIADPGNYTIVLDVGVAGNYLYSLKKN